MLILNSYRATRKEAGDLERLVEAIQTSETHVKNTAYSKLDVISQQIKFLQQQAHDILKNASEDSKLHKIPCNFVKVPGTLYHLYERSTGDKFWSMISPDEFGDDNPNEHIGSYRMEVDRSFTRVELLEEFAENRKFAEALMKNIADVNTPAIKFIAKSDEPEL
jgi:Protein of unknown function (DUF2452)